MEHHHADHAAAPKPAASLAELHHPGHGSYEGHVVPGVMFIALASYWLWSILDIHLRSPPAHHPQHVLPLTHHVRRSSSSSHKQQQQQSGAGAGSSGSRLARRWGRAGREEPFVSRAWYPWPFWPAPHLEPLCKLTLPLVGVLIELYIGWGGWRPLYSPDGHFAQFHANNWQHALMYASFALSGGVDLIGHYTPLPAGTEQGFLALAFLVETLLMGMHKKHNPLDQLVHSLLTYVMAACAAAAAAEIAAPRSLLLALLRGMLVFLQGTWFWHVGSIMFRDSMAWDMEDMGSVMFIPVVFSLHLLLITLGVFTVYLFMRLVYGACGILASSSSSSHAYLPLHPSRGTKAAGFDDDDDDDGVMPPPGFYLGQQQQQQPLHSLETALELTDYPSPAPSGAGLHQQQQQQQHDALAARSRDVSSSAALPRAAAKGGSHLL